MIQMTQDPCIPDSYTATSVHFYPFILFILLLVMVFLSARLFPFHSSSKKNHLFGLF